MVLTAQCLLLICPGRLTPGCAWFDFSCEIVFFILPPQMITLKMMIWDEMWFWVKVVSGEYVFYRMKNIVLSRRYVGMTAIIQVYDGRSRVVAVTQ